MFIKSDCGLYDLISDLVSYELTSNHLQIYGNLQALMMVMFVLDHRDKLISSRFRAEPKSPSTVKWFESTSPLTRISVFWTDGFEKNGFCCMKPVVTGSQCPCLSSQLTFRPAAAMLKASCKTIPGWGQCYTYHVSAAICISNQVYL